MSKKKYQNATNAEMIKRLSSFEVDQDWQFLRKVMQENVDFLSEQILSGYSLEQGETYGKKLTPREIDRLRDKREVQIDLMELPRTIADQMREYDSEEENFDPFPTNIKDLRRMKEAERESAKREPEEIDQ